MEYFFGMFLNKHVPENNDILVVQIPKLGGNLGPPSYCGKMGWVRGRAP